MGLVASWRDRHRDAKSIGSFRLETGAGYRMERPVTATGAAETRTRAAAAPFVLAGLPVVFLLAALLVEAFLGDFPDDPNYAYLFNGVNIAQLRAPAQFDHPGTAIQIV